MNDLATINIDLPSAIAMTVGKLSGIMALRDSAKALAGFDATSGRDRHQQGEEGLATFP